MFADLPAIISGDRIAYLDPQEKIWPRQSGQWFGLSDSELKGKADLAMFDGIEDFTSTTTHYSKTLFRFPLRTEQSALSMTTYTADSLIKLIDALRDEAKVLLLFLRSVHTIEVYSITSGSSQHKLHLKVQVAPEHQAHLMQARTSFMSQLKAAHTLCEYRITPCIPRVVKFAVNITDLENELYYHTKSTSWLVANQVGSTNAKVLKAAKGQCCFPWVGIAMELDEHLALCSPSELSVGRIFCFLPMPVEMSSELPVHVNGTFGLNDDRRTIKWPVGERRNDETAQWNQMLVTKCLPFCYNLLLKTAINEHHITPELFYHAWPSIESLKNTQWSLLIEPLLTLLFQWECLWSQLCTKWVTTDQATVIPDNGIIAEVVKKVLTKCGLMLCTVPQHVFKALGDSVHHISPSIACNKLRGHYNSYRYESYNDKLDLLRYCLLGKDFSNLVGLELLPVADFTFKSFSKIVHPESHCYVCSQHFPRKLLPNLGHVLVDLLEIDSTLHTQLETVAKSNETQLRMLSVKTVAQLLPKCYPRDWMRKQTVCAQQNDDKFPFEWWTTFWEWVQQRVNDLSPFRGQFVVPLVTSSKHSSMYVTKLVPKSAIVAMENSDYCHPSLLVAFQKLHIQCVSLWHFNKLRHQQLFTYSYLNRCTPLGILTAISNSGCKVESVSFTDAEAAEIQRFLVSQSIHPRFSLPHKNILENLHIFRVLNHSSLVSLTGAAHATWRGQVILEPKNFTFSSESLPFNLVILSRS